MLAVISCSVKLCAIELLTSTLTALPPSLTAPWFTLLAACSLETWDSTMHQCAPHSSDSQWFDSVRIETISLHVESHSTTDHQRSNHLLQGVHWSWTLSENANQVLAHVQMLPLLQHCQSPHSLQLQQPHSAKLHHSHLQHLLQLLPCSHQQASPTPHATCSNHHQRCLSRNDLPRSQIAADCLASSHCHPMACWWSHHRLNKCMDASWEQPVQSSFLPPFF